MYYQNFTTFSTNSTCPALLFFTQGQGLAMPQRLLLSLQLQQLCLILLLFFWYIVANVLRYTGWFFWSASISVPKWKPTSSQSRHFFNSNRIYCTSSRAWLLEGFLFGAEIWGDQLKKSPSIWTCFSKFHECIAAATHVLSSRGGTFHINSGLGLSWNRSGPI